MPSEAPNFPVRTASNAVRERRTAPAVSTAHLIGKQFYYRSANPNNPERIFCMASRAQKMTRDAIPKNNLDDRRRVPREPIGIGSTVGAVSRRGTRRPGRNHKKRTAILFLLTDSQKIALRHGVSLGAKDVMDKNALRQGKPILPIEYAGHRVWHVPTRLVLRSSESSPGNSLEYSGVKIAPSVIFEMPENRK